MPSKVPEGTIGIFIGCADFLTPHCAVFPNARHLLQKVRDVFRQGEAKTLLKWRRSIASDTFLLPPPCTQARTVHMHLIIREETIIAFATVLLETRHSHRVQLGEGGATLRLMFASKLNFSCLKNGCWNSMAEFFAEVIMPFSRATTFLKPSVKAFENLAFFCDITTSKGFKIFPLAAC